MSKHSNEVRLDDSYLRDSLLFFIYDLFILELLSVMFSQHNVSDNSTFK